MNGKYILNGKNPVKCEDLMQWEKEMENASRIVEQTQLGNIKISTVFLGLDYSFNNSVFHNPILFETMVFGGEHDGYCAIYSTWDQAAEGHKDACGLVS